MAIMFFAVFNRYSPKKATGEQSGVVQIPATTFQNAYTDALLTMRAYAEARPEDDWKYDLVSLVTHDYRPDKVFKGYISPWQDPPSEDKGKGKA